MACIYNLFEGSRYNRCHIYPSIITILFGYINLWKRVDVRSLPRSWPRVSDKCQIPHLGYNFGEDFSMIFPYPMRNKIRACSSLLNPLYRQRSRLPKYSFKSLSDPMSRETVDDELRRNSLTKLGRLLFKVFLSLRAFRRHAQAFQVMKAPSLDYRFLMYKQLD